MHCINPAHCEQPLSLICVDAGCGQQGLICSQCELESHVNHKKLATKQFIVFLEHTISEEESAQNMLSIAAQIDSMCLWIRTTLFDLKICQSLTERNRVDLAINNFTLFQRQEIQNNNTLLRSMLKQLQNRDGAQIFNQIFRSAIHKFQIVKEEKSTSKKMVFGKFVLATTENTKECIEACIKNKSDISTILSCLIIKGKPLLKFKFSEINKGKTIKLIDPYTAIMEQSGSERMILMDPSLESRSSNTKWKIHILSKKSWIGVGMCHINSIKNANFNFEYTQMGHGNYLISSNGYSWSSLKPEFNSHFGPFTFDTGDTIEITYSPKTKTIEFAKVGTQEKYSLDFEFRSGDPLHPAINLTGVGDSVQIIQ